ncbi:hypothetical protein [Hafnia alvei]|uniref:hypothetical protein n=1 Tax=Hafnia alvei TaxID=569 RepID=UPI000694089E|nr:hypothetical protein [Hafnia alvei]
MLDFIRDIYTSFRQTSLERVKSPFLGAFVFSWIGFNWQMLAIVLFSKRSIEERLELINKSFDISDYLLAPIFTTALIVTILPQVNKFITKIQDKPNTDTIELALVSKIKIAELQQSLADSEARKKLADKREEKFIEEGIYAIKAEFEKTKDELKALNESEQESSKVIHDLRGDLAKAESKLDVEQESKLQTQNNLSEEINKNSILSERIIKITSELETTKLHLSSSVDTYTRTLNAYNKLKEKYETLEVSIRDFNKRYPYVIDVEITNDVATIGASERAKIMLGDINKSLSRPRSSDDYLNKNN